LFVYISRYYDLKNIKGIAMALVLESKKDKQKVKNTILKDDNGYYKVTLGAFNTFNASGIYYNVPDINKILGPGSMVHRRIDKGVLFAELDHPDLSPYNGDRLKISQRVIKLDPSRKIAHIKKIEVETLPPETGFKNPIYKIYGWVRPEGPYKDILQEALENEDENVYFSVRSLVKERKVGSIRVRDVILVSTWDYVVEGGIHMAHQWNAAAGIESMDLAVDIDDKITEELINGYEYMDCDDGKCVIKTLKDAIVKTKPLVLEW
jgi:hypothetical protein